MNKDKRNNIKLLGTLNNADESGIIANANQIYDANEDKSTQDVSKEHTERIKTLETKENSMQTTLENITKTGEASAASNVTYNHSDSKLDATNVQQAIDEVSSIGHFAKRGGVINISTNYNNEHTAEVLTLAQALSKVPSTDRVLGFQGKYLASDGWHTIIYIGDSLTSWSDTTKWIDLSDKILRSISKNATFGGIATPTTNPVAPDGPVFYIASEPGIYTNFGNVELTDQVIIFTNENNNWIKQETGIATSAKISELELNNRNINFVIGGLSSLDGAETNDLNRLRSSFIYENVKFKFKEGFESYAIIAYDIDDNFKKTKIGTNITNISLAEGEKARIVVRKADNSNFENVENPFSEYSLDRYSNTYIDELDNKSNDLFDFKIGTIAVATGIEGSDKRRLRSKFIETDVANITYNGDYESYAIITYDLDGNYISGSTDTTITNIIVESGTKKRLIVRRKNDLNIDETFPIQSFEKGYNVAISNIQKEVSDVKDRIFSDLLTIIGSAPRQADGIIQPTNSYKRSDYLPLASVGSIVYNKLNSSASFGSWYYDVNKKPISSVFGSEYGQKTGILSEHPQNAYYIILAGINNNDDSNAYAEHVTENLISIGEQSVIDGCSVSTISGDNWLNSISVKGDKLNNSAYTVKRFPLVNVVAIEILSKCIDSSQPVLMLRDNNFKAITEILNTSTDDFESHVINIQEYANAKYADFGCITDNINDLDKCYINFYYKIENPTYIFDKKTYDQEILRNWSDMHCLPYMIKKMKKKPAGIKADDYYLNIALNTDSHGYTPNVFRRIYKWVYEERNYWALNLFLSLGDINSYEPTNSRDKNRYFAINKNIFRTIDKYGNNAMVPQLFCIGNHDTNQEITNFNNVEFFANKSEQFEAIIKPMLARFSSNHSSFDVDGEFSNYFKLDIITASENEHPTYYYFDTKNKYDKSSYNLRIICLDAYDFPDEILDVTHNSNTHDDNENCFSQKQIAFIYNALRDAMEKSLSVCICVHDLSFKGCGNSVNVVNDMLVAFRNSTSCITVLNDYATNSSELESYTFDFTGSNGKIFVLQGHGHEFIKFKITNSSIGEKTVSRYMVIASNGPDTKMPRALGQDCFDILSYDDNEGIKFVRYGNANGMYDYHNNDGSDYNGFHYIDKPEPI